MLVGRRATFLQEQMALRASQCMGDRALCALKTISRSQLKTDAAPSQALAGRRAAFLREQVARRSAQRMGDRAARRRAASLAAATLAGWRRRAWVGGVVRAMLLVRQAAYMLRAWQCWRGFVVARVTAHVGRGDRGGNVGAILVEGLFFAAGGWLGARKVAGVPRVSAHRVVGGAVKATSTCNGSLWQTLGLGWWGRSLSSWRGDSWLCSVILDEASCGRMYHAGCLHAGRLAMARAVKGSLTATLQSLAQYSNDSRLLSGPSCLRPEATRRLARQSLHGALAPLQRCGAAATRSWAGAPMLPHWRRGAASSSLQRRRQHTVTAWVRGYAQNFVPQLALPRSLPLGGCNLAAHASADISIFVCASLAAVCACWHMPGLLCKPIGQRCLRRK